MKIAIGMSCLLLAGLTLAGFEGAGSKPAGKPPLTPAEKDEPRLIYADGLVEGRARSVELQFEIEGRLVELLVEEGEPVTAGQPLARIEDALHRAELARAEAQLKLQQARRLRLVNGSRPERRAVADAEVDVAKVAAELALRERERAATLFRKDALSESDWDQRDHDARMRAAELVLAESRSEEVHAEARADDLLVIDAEIAAAEAAVDRAESMLDRTVLRAPTDGTVLRIEYELGQLLGPAAPQPLLTFTDQTELRVRAFVEKYDALRIAAGSPCRVQLKDGSDTQFPGRVIWCSPMMTSKTFRADRPGEQFDVPMREVLVKLEEPGSLIVGLPVEVFISPVMPAASQDEAGRQDVPIPETETSPSTGSPRPLETAQKRSP